MEVAGLVLAIAPILAGFMKTVKDIYDIRAKYNAIPSSMQAIAAYCGLVHVALLHLKSQQFQEALILVPENAAQALEHVEILLLGCKGVLCQIEAYTVQYAMAAEQISMGQRPGLDILRLTKIVWKEPEIKDLLAQLKDYKDGIDTVRQICMSHSLESIHTKLSHHTSTLDLLLERSRKSWNHDPPLILASRPESLRFSFISHLSLFSTTALYINQDHDRQSTTAFDFDYEVVNSKSYQRSTADGGRHASTVPAHRHTADSPSALGGQVEDGLGSSPERGTNPDASATDETLPMPTQILQTPENGGDSGHYRTDAHHSRNTSEGAVDDHLWRLHDRRPAATKNFSRPDRSIQPSSSSTGSVITPSNKSSSPAVIPLPTKSPSPMIQPLSTTSDPPKKSKSLRSYQVAVLGGGGVDKSRLVIQFLDSLDDTTIEYTYQRICMVDDEAVIIDVVDTAGQEEYSAMREQYMRNSQGFALIYSITSRQSFEIVQVLHQEILRVWREKDKDYFPVALVGNHCDRESEREVSKEEGADLARQWDCAFLEASTNTRVNVDEVFVNGVREIRKYEKRVLEEQRRLEQEQLQRDIEMQRYLEAYQANVVDKRSSTSRLLSPLLERFRG